jgi:hypothetical protein
MPVKIDEDNLKTGILGLVVALVEIIQEVLERESLRRIEQGQLTDDEIDRLGNGLMELDEAIDKLKKENGLNNTVNMIRSDLDHIVEDTIDLIANPKRLANTE